MFITCLLTIAVDMPSRPAALENAPESTTCRNTLMLVSVSIWSYLPQTNLHASSPGSVDRIISCRSAGPCGRQHPTPAGDLTPPETGADTNNSMK